MKMFMFNIIANMNWGQFRKLPSKPDVKFVIFEKLVVKEYPEVMGNQWDKLCEALNMFDDSSKYELKKAHEDEDLSEFDDSETLVGDFCEEEIPSDDEVEYYRMCLELYDAKFRIVELEDAAVRCELASLELGHKVKQLESHNMSSEAVFKRKLASYRDMVLLDKFGPRLTEFLSTEIDTRDNELDLMRWKLRAVEDREFGLEMKIKEIMLRMKDLEMAEVISSMK